MGDSQVACALSNEPIYGSCMFVVLGPNGYGPHGHAPAMQPGGCKFPGYPEGDSVCYRPMSLPILGSVGSTWGEMDSCLDEEHDAFLRRSWGASAQEIINAIVHERGNVVGDGFKSAVSIIDNKRLESYDKFNEKTDAEIEEEVRADDEFRRRIFPERPEPDLTFEERVRHRIYSYQQTMQMKEDAKRNAYGAAWADVMHVSVEAWNELLDAWKEQGQGDDGWFNHSLSEYGRPIYESVKDTEHFRRLGVGLEALSVAMYSVGGYRPSFIANQDSLVEKIRLRMLRFSERALSDRLQRIQSW